MSKSKKEESTNDLPQGVSHSKHGALNNLNMIMFYMRKKNLPEEYFQEIEVKSREILNELKAL